MYLLSIHLSFSGAYIFLFLQDQVKELLERRAEAVTPTRRRRNSTTDGQNGDDDGTKDDKLSRRILLTLIRIIDAIWKNLPLNSEQFKAAFKFLLDLCQERTISKSFRHIGLFLSNDDLFSDDLTVAKSLWQMLLRMHRRVSKSGTLAELLSKNMRYQFGDILVAVSDFYLRYFIHLFYSKVLGWHWNSRARYGLRLSYA